MKERWLFICCPLAAKTGQVDGLVWLGILSSIKWLLGTELEWCVSLYLGLGRGKTLPEEASLGGGFQWAKDGPYQWALFWGFVMPPLGFWLGSSPNQILLSLMWLPRFNRVVKGIWVKIWMINNMWKWFIQVIKQLIKKNGPHRVEIKI